MAGRLEGKVAVITGAASGIGLGTVELFVAEGARVVAADIQDEKGAMLETRFPGKVAYVHCDVTQEAEIEAAMKRAKTEFGGLDILFNNAGISDRMTSIAEITADGWSWIFDVLVRGPALGMKHALPLMLERGGGSIINTASIAGLQAGWGPIAYSSAKASVIHMSRSAAAQLSPQKIRVNAICPGLIATSIFGASMGLPRDVADQMAARVADNAAKVQPVPKAGMPEDIAKAALYLASEDSAFVSGTHIVVDGGITVGGRHAWDATAGSPFAALFGDALPGATA
ncbi:MAG: SDR family oxidoreductase [Phenylobacterium sp.]|jgi:NAD(P)-dependent dehydrogenase (short-subunit alcohol dehydrogenase family)|uniref:SDR family NAD(P)-dependent oxidoreductase n=1 Tax=Phenylobacterium sp. TaxID=1871053 RepID=UPI001B611FBE|nr:SDR family oxidoreductase [Phenylobacterium sp.]MBP7817632.1 SDR family oxidoreductase [Phenylobacterium sp.]MBP9230933.1 SDR family oxidoreductase [Phenylobacterium sp.]MBP9756566.1 SDR family oxidoreductase [Phenylobacterium sp.]